MSQPSISRKRQTSTPVLNLQERSDRPRSGIFSPVRRQSISWKLLLSCFVCLLLGAAVAGSGRIRENEPAEPSSSSKSRFDCLPKDVQLNDVVSYGKTAKGNVTVEKTLLQMKAQCRKSKLVDARRREIRFFRPSCWGNPPPDYLEIQQRENSELQKLKKTYAVIVFACSRMTQ